MTAMSNRKASADIVFGSEAMVPLALVDLSSDQRKYSQTTIQAMAENIAVFGQRQAIEVVTLGDRYQLVFGKLRFEAISFLGQAEIRANVKRQEEFSAQVTPRLVSIVENMARSELTKLDRSIAIADWCALYRAAQGPLKPGPKSASAERAELSLNLILNSADTELMAASAAFSASFSEAAQHFLGVSRAAVFRALKIAAIPGLQRDRIALHPLADNQSELTALADEPADRQAAILDLILGERARNVAEALGLLDERPRVTKHSWELVAEKFARMVEPDQDRFFDLQEPAIVRWMAKKGRK
ncbi:ParB-like nuclease domain-containing protein [Rhizobium leguminosarum bv. viciae 248]|uniref:ParB/RepB/Spo0J family partition protein n=1 Tax=Rhizobium leguminosarum TaxID=384 RepID=UPI0009B7896C|nr:ParB N-terminal domain-containing protein [Rhizobium leguminosarum]QHW25852.1 ParB-like nuclease domain-containing protein [Rhizobium leguminosarum bv. viciae 248]